jgi:hypothetical protein
VRHISIDRTDDGRFKVRILSGIKGDKTSVFDEHSEANGFAISKLGRAGMIVDTTTMTSEQLAAHRARGAALRESLGRHS